LSIYEEMPVELIWR